MRLDSRASLHLTQVVLIWLLLNHLALFSAADEKFKYRNRKVEFDSFKDLFGQNGVGLLRRVLFEKYLQASPEGRQRGPLPLLCLRPETVAPF